MIGGGVLASCLWCRGSRAVSRWPGFVFVCLASMVGGASIATAQDAATRLHQVHSASEPEGRLLAYYSAAMVFTPVGSLPPGARWIAGLEGTWIPPLNESQRRPGIDKPETTNLAPVLPRPRVALRTRVAEVEASWVPPIKVADAQANLVSFAASRRVASWHRTAIATRLSIVSGRVEGAITCNASTAARGGSTLATYYAAVCHGRDSEDWFEPRLAAGELVARRGVGERAATAGVPRGDVWLAVGARVDRSRFDIGVIRTDGSRDPDHPVLELRDTRPHAAGGFAWRLGHRLSAAVEGFYAPGSVATLRLFGAVVGGGR